MTRRDETGVAFVLLAITIPLILLLVAGAVDIARIVLARAELQRTTDAAALSSVAAIPNLQRIGSDAKMKILAEQFNGTPGTANPFVNDVFNSIQADIDFDTDATIVRWLPNGTLAENPLSTLANGVKIATSIPVPSTLGSLFGFNQFTVSTTSTAILSAPDCFQVTFPIVIMNCEGVNNVCNYAGCNQLIEVKLTSSQTDNAVIFGTAWPPSEQECENVVDGGSPIKCAGEMIYLNNGGLGGCLQHMKAKCDDLNKCNPPTEPEPWFVNIPFVNCADFPSQPHGQIPIKGFARVGILRIRPTGNPKGIDVVRVCDSISFGAPGGGQHCGLFTPPRLIE